MGTKRVAYVEAALIIAGLQIAYQDVIMEQDVVDLKFNLHQQGNDLVGDTPTQETYNFGCPTFPHRTCGNTSMGDMFMNFMDYVDDPCMIMFSNGQNGRAQATIRVARRELMTSLGCTPLQIYNLNQDWQDLQDV